MSGYHFSLQAEQDLDDIVDHVSRSSTANAARLVQRLHQACRNLAQFPGIRIIRVLHGARNFSPSLFNTP